MSKMCWYDEAFTINEMKEETNFCKTCKHYKCSNKKTEILEAWKKINESCTKKNKKR